MKAITRFVGEYEFLSNFYCSPIIHNSLLFKSVEHAFQAEKSLDEEIWREFAYNTKTPADAKRKGRMITLRPDWEEIKYDRMKLFVHKKFKLPPLRKFLLDTGNAHLEEGNNHGDTTWGTVNGKGRNWLGKILMEVREEKRREMEHKNTVVKEHRYLKGLRDG